MSPSKPEFVWQVGLENLCAAYERAQIELAKEFLGSDYDPNYVRPEPDPRFDFIDEFDDPELLSLLLEQA